METIRRGRPPKAADEQTQVEKIVEPKKGTKPGWRPSSVLPQLKAPTGFTARWVRNESGNLAKKMAEGWILMKPKDNVGIEIRQDTPDSHATASEIRFRDQIAMMIADDDKQARQEYIREQNREAQRQVLEKTDSQLRSFGVQSYAPKGQSGRIVIE